VAETSRLGLTADQLIAILVPVGLPTVNDLKVSVICR